MTEERRPVRVRAESTPALAPDIIEAARSYSAASRAHSTRDNYERAWEAFSAWCRENGQHSLPAHPVTVAAYLASEAARGVGHPGCSSTSQPSAGPTDALGTWLLTAPNRER